MPDETREKGTIYFFLALVVVVFVVVRTLILSLLHRSSHHHYDTQPGQSGLSAEPQNYHCPVGTN